MRRYDSHPARVRLRRTRVELCLPLKDTGSTAYCFVAAVSPSWKPVMAVARCKDRHEVELFFHLHEDTRINVIDTGAADTTWRGRLFASPNRALTWKVVRGRDHLILGWHSRYFSQKRPIPTFHMTSSPHGTTTIQTTIQTEE